MNDISIKISYIRLLMTFSIGPVNFWKLINRYGNAENALKYVSKPGKFSEAEREIKLHEENGAELIFSFEESFPKVLKFLRDCPPFISVIGNKKLLNGKIFGIVGGRNASINSQFFIKMLAEKISEKNITVVSGLARGIDSAAHAGALLQQGKTIAVLPSGINIIYPKESEELYFKIAKNGILISEMPYNKKIDPAFFPRRNRIIARLSSGILISDASKNSGSLITAEYALDYGVEIFAVPGHPTDPKSFGGNFLIKEGGTLVRNVDDILRNLNFHKIDDYNFFEKNKKNLFNMKNINNEKIENNVKHDVKNEIKIKDEIQKVNNFKNEQTNNFEIDLINQMFLKFFKNYEEEKIKKILKLIFIENCKTQEEICIKINEESIIKILPLVIGKLEIYKKISLNENGIIKVSL